MEKHWLFDLGGEGKGKIEIEEWKREKNGELEKHLLHVRRCTLNDGDRW